MSRVTIKGTELTLLPEKAIWWNDKRTLIMSDVHFGKVTHFRKNGIQAPASLIHKQIVQMRELFEKHEPEHLIVIGDLFHSDLNSEWTMFTDLLASFTALKVTLVRGNHDRMPAFVLKQASIKVTTTLIIDELLFSHEPVEHHFLYVLSGHVHPGVRLHGAGKQSLSLPCFYFNSNYALLPAFGNFTGLQMVKTSKTDQVYVITGNDVLQLN